MNRLKLGSILALVAGPFILVMNYLETSEKKQIDKAGIEAVAIPVSKMERRGRKGGRTYKLEIEFPTKDAKTQTAQVEVSKELYENIEAKPILRVKYLEDKPTQVIVVGEPMGKPELMYVGIAVFLVGIGGTWWYFIRKKPEAAEPETAAA
jgi:hypothetical protein